MNEILINTDRLIIKHGNIEDYIKIHEYNFNYLQYIDGEYSFIKNNLEMIREWFSKYSSMNEYYDSLIKNNSYDLLVFLKNNLAIGQINFDRYDDFLNSLELSCFLHPFYWNRGYMYEALISFMNYIYKQGYDNIIYSYIVDNIASKKLCDKIGFKFFYSINQPIISDKLNMTNVFIMSKDDYNEIYGKNFVKKIKR